MVILKEKVGQDNCIAIMEYVYIIITPSSSTTVLTPASDQNTPPQTNPHHCAEWQSGR